MNSDYRNAQVLVTGAAGFLGRHLVRALLAAGATVHGVSRRSMVGTGSQVHWWRSALETQSDVDRVLDGAKADIVFHLSGCVTGGTDPALVLPTLESLFGSTIRLLVGLVRREVRRVVLAGSLTEPEPGAAFPIPGSPYAAAKWTANAYGRMFHALYGTPLVVIRPGMTYGPGQPSTRLLPFVLASLARQEAPHLTSGLLEADWIFVDDVIDAFMRAACAPGVEGATIDVGSGETRTARYVVARLVDLFRGLIGPCPDPIFGALPDRPLERVHAADVEAAFQRLGWRATTSLDEGLRRLIVWHGGGLGLEFRRTPTE